jgi:tetratricopeptide (TPR) repeat protein
MHFMQMILHAEGEYKKFRDGFAGCERGHQTRFRLLRTELALRAYQLEHGRFPSRLEELVPEHLAEVPKDPFSGEPLFYELKGKDYVVYSIGFPVNEWGGPPREADAAGDVSTVGGSGPSEPEQASELDTQIADSTKGIQSRPGDAHQYLIRGELYGMNDQWDKAIADFTKAIALNPQIIGGHLARARAYQTKGDHDRAIADFTKAIALNPKRIEGYLGRGWTYQAKGDHDKAIADCTAAIQIDPEVARAHSMRGESYRQKGDFDKAIADFNQVIRLNREADGPEAGWTYEVRGRVYLEKGDLDRAIADFSEAIRFDGEFFGPDVYRARGDAYLKKGEKARALVDYKEAKKRESWYTPAPARTPIPPGDKTGESAKPGAK